MSGCSCKRFEAGVISIRNQRTRRGTGGRAERVVPGFGTVVIVGKGSKRAYKVVPVDGDEPAFGDPPRNWGRVASMAGVWAIVLLAGAWMAPSFASGGNEGDTDARDQPATDEINAASRYLRFGSDGDTERVEAVLCDGAAPETGASDLVDLRESYEGELGTYPEVEVDTQTPIASPDGYEVDATVSYISGDGIREESFTVTILLNGGDYCVAEAVRHIEDDPSGGPGELDLDILRFIVWDRDPDAATATQCSDYTGPSAQKLLDAVEAWESANGEGTSYAVPIGSEARATPNAVTTFPYEVVMDGEGTDQTFNFEVTISGECVLEVSGGEDLLAYAGD
ncbi:hypothetical protein [Glycomyces tarimensis]